MYKLDSPSDIYLGSVSSAGFCIGLISNLLVISHLLTKTWQRSKLRGSNLARGRVTSRDTLFLVLATVDLVITGLHVVCAVSLFSYQKAGFTLGPVCISWGLLWNMSTRLSVFTIMLLAADLCFNIRKSKTVLQIFSGYLLLQVVQATLPFWFGYSYRYSHYREMCTWGNFLTVGSPGWIAYNLVVEVLEFSLPCLITSILLIRNIFLHRANVLPPLSHDGTERDTEFMYNPFQDTTSSASSSSSSDNTKPSPLLSLPTAASRHTVIAVTTFSLLLSIPHTVAATLEFCQVVEGKRYFFSSFPPDTDKIKLCAVVIYSVGVAAKAWFQPVLYLMGESRKVVKWGRCK